MDNIQYKQYTNRGGREINEDCTGIAVNQDSYCFAVADGLGGHGGGEIAAQLAVDAVCSAFVEEGFSEAFFEHAFCAAQESILDEQVCRRALSQMKTTLVVLVLHKDIAYWAHVGDSRLYYFQKNKYRLRTLDHSVPQMLALSGDIRESDIRNHPDRNRLMEVLGVQNEKPRIDIGKPLRLKPEQAFLLCTDGFWELVTEEEMELALSESDCPDTWIEKMQNLVTEHGTGTEMDNFTAIAVQPTVKHRFGRWL